MRVALGVFGLLLLAVLVLQAAIAVVPLLTPKPPVSTQRTLKGF